MADYQPFESWSQVIDHVLAGDPLYYHAPMDVRPVQVTAKIRRDTKLRIYPSNPYVDPFTADAGHLDRFRRRASRQTS